MISRIQMLQVLCFIGEKIDDITAMEARKLFHLFASQDEVA